MDDFQQPIQEASNLAPLAVVMLVVLSALIWVLPRRLALWPLLVMMCTMPLGQQLVLFGFNFHLFRLLILAGVLRVVLRGEARQINFTATDWLFIAWVAVGVVFGSVSKPSVNLLVYRLGEAYNSFGCYLFVRCVMVDFDDFVDQVSGLAWLSLLVAGLMVFEKLTARNLLSVFGGVPEFTEIRGGDLRCQGPFRHPILAGSFGATQFALFAGLWFYNRAFRKAAVVGMVSAFLIVFTAKSSGALLALMAAIGGLCFWRWRGYLRFVRWGTVVGILLLAVVMKAPVWYLFDRLSSVTGGTGWHRAYLIDQALLHFDEWWLFGTTYTAHWGPSGEVTAGDTNMMDITNHYIMEGVKGGALRLALFLIIVWRCFKAIGRRLNLEGEDLGLQHFVWGAGVALFAHCFSFVSITYFDQIVVVWFWLLAFASRADILVNSRTCAVGEPGETLDEGPAEDSPDGTFVSRKPA